MTISVFSSLAYLTFGAVSVVPATVTDQHGNTANQFSQITFVDIPDSVTVDYASSPEDYSYNGLKPLFQGMHGFVNACFGKNDPFGKFYVSIVCKNILDYPSCKNANCNSWSWLYRKSSYHPWTIYSIHWSYVPSRGCINPRFHWPIVEQTNIFCNLNSCRSSSWTGRWFPSFQHWFNLVGKSLACSCTSEWKFSRISIELLCIIDNWQLLKINSNLAVTETLQATVLFSRPASMAPIKIPFYFVIISLQLAKWGYGYGACIVVGLLFIFIFPIVGCCFCCCRTCCGNCGGKMVQKRDDNYKMWRACYIITLFISCTFLG